MDSAKETTVQNGSWTTGQILEYRHQVNKGVEAGIPREFIENVLSKDTFQSYLSPDGKNTEQRMAEACRLTDLIFSAATNWAFKGVYLVVEGESTVAREYVSRVCLFRGIIARSMYPARVGYTVTMSELAGILIGSSPMYRTNYTETLKRVPVVYVKDLDPVKELKDWSGSREVFDGLLNGREISNLPTIISVTGGLEQMSGVAERYGAKVGDIFTPGKDTTIWLKTG